MTIGVRQRRTAVDVGHLAESVPAVVMLAFTLELCARSPVNLHANGTNRMIAPYESEAPPESRVPQLAQHDQNGATN
jgi:hypothetical protein